MKKSRPKACERTNFRTEKGPNWGRVTCSTTPLERQLDVRHPWQLAADRCEGPSYRGGVALYHCSEGREWGVGSVVVEFGVFGAPRFSVQRSQNPLKQVFWDLWTENRGAPKTPNSTTTDPTPHSRPSELLYVKTPGNLLRHV